MHHFASISTRSCVEIERVKHSQRPKPAPAQFEPSEEWLDQLASQCTPQLLERTERYVAYQIAQIAKFGYSADAYAARELVQDALHDTVAGILHWEPTEKSLEEHLIDVLRLRTKRVRMHAERFPRWSLDGETDAGGHSAGDALAAKLHDDAPSVGTSEYVHAAMTELRQLARGDELVMRILYAFAKEATERDDVMFVTGFSDVEYENARRRLRKLVRKLNTHARGRRGIKGD